MRELADSRPTQNLAGPFVDGGSADSRFRLASRKELPARGLAAPHQGSAPTARFLPRGMSSGAPRARPVYTLPSSRSDADPAGRSGGTSAPQTGHKSERWVSFRVIQGDHETRNALRPPVWQFIAVQPPDLPRLGDLPPHCPPRLCPRPPLDHCPPSIAGDSVEVGDG
jgi:hypothetical protein